MKKKEAHVIGMVVRLRHVCLGNDAALKTFDS